MRPQINAEKVKKVFDSSLLETGILANLQDEVVRQQASLMIYGYLKHELDYQNALRRKKENTSSEGEHITANKHYIELLTHLIVCTKRTDYQ